MVFDSQLIAKVSKRIVVELFAIVRDMDPKDPKSANDAFPDKATDILHRDSC